MSAETAPATASTPAPPDFGERPRVSIVIPVYNEIETLEIVIGNVRKLEDRYDLEFVLVDDCSTDGSRDLVERLGTESWCTAKLHEKNRGKGAAVRTAFEACTGDIVVIQDADLEYDPADIPTLLGPILTRRADVVYGSRFLGGPHRVLYFWHSVGNKFLTLVSNMFSNLNLSDMEVGYKAFRLPVLQSLELTAEQFGIEVEITARISKAHWRVFEVPISYNGRTYEEGKKITWRDGIAAFWHIVRFNLFG